MLRVDVNPKLYKWARERSGLAVPSERFPKLQLWERGEEKPTLKQLEAFAQATHTPVGFFFLPEPPHETLPIADLRAGNVKKGRPSPELIDTIHACQARQDWYREYALRAHEEEREFVGSAGVHDSIDDTAARMRAELKFELSARDACKTSEDAFRYLVSLSEDAGVLVMCSGIVGSNTSRPLDSSEFRGFALVDKLAPLVFVNTTDTKAAQMFTLAHELAHVWVGASAVSDAEAGHVPHHNTEEWCNRVAAELLVPLDIIKEEHRVEQPFAVETGRLARRYKVSTLVIMRRLFDAERIKPSVFKEAYKAEIAKLRVLAQKQTTGGGNFYVTTVSRVGRRFARALTESIIEGRTLYRDAMHMLGVSNVETLRKLERFVHS